jgi:hypothetical protein
MEREEKTYTRRDFLKIAGLTLAGTALSACKPNIPGYNFWTHYEIGDIFETPQIKATKTPTPTPGPVSIPVDKSKDFIYGIGGAVGIITTYAINRFIRRKLSQPKSVINSDQPRMENLPTTHHSVGDNVPEILHPLKKDVLWYKDGKPYHRT